MLQSSVCTCLTLAARHPHYSRHFKMSWYIKVKLSRQKNSNLEFIFLIQKKSKTAIRV